MGCQLLDGGKNAILIVSCVSEASEGEASRGRARSARCAPADIILSRVIPVLRSRFEGAGTRAPVGGTGVMGGMLAATVCDLFVRVLQGVAAASLASAQHQRVEAEASREPASARALRIGIRKCRRDA